MFSMGIVASLSLQMCYTLSQKVGMKIRSTVSMAVYNKLLTMRLSSLIGASKGLMLNLVTNDTQKLLEAAMFFNFGWFALVEFGTISALAVAEVGVSAIPGVVVGFLVQALQAYMGHVGGQLRSKSVRYTDARVHLTEEILNGIRVIKYNGWTVPFMRLLAELRQKEMFIIRRASFLRAATSTVRDSVTPLACLVTFGTYYAIHKEKFMPPSMAFTALALFNILGRVLLLAPLGFQSAAEAVVAVRRLQKLLDMEELQLEDDNLVPSSDAHIMALDCAFSWGQNSLKSKSFRTAEESDAKSKIKFMDSPRLPPARDLFESEGVLHDINFSVKEGESVAIRGPIGCGKSSLLFGLLGEMKALKGKVLLKRNVAYVPQQPWILNATVRQNIILGSPFDLDKYQRVVAACALEQDISRFAGGHDSELGDRGLNLSGGQKARMSLARACYSSAPVVFLDDPLAAVDAATAKHLIQHVLNGVLKGRTIVLVTYNERALAVCDCIYYMENGHLTDASKDLKTTNSLGSSDASEEEIMTFGYQRSKSLYEVDHDIFESRREIQLPIDDGRGKSTIDEDKVEGSVHFSTWMTYAKASRGCYWFSFVILVFMIGQAVRLIVDYWMRLWTEQKYKLKQEIYLAAYGGLIGMAITLSLCKLLLFTHVTNIAAIKMHGQMVKAVMSSPQLFFDQNVAGRILNRFSKDQAIVDEALPNTTQLMLEYGISCFGSLILIGVLMPWFFLVCPPMLLMFWYAQRRYLIISRELKRLEATARSPIYAHITQTFQGIVSVRAYGIQCEMQKAFMLLVDATQSPYIHFVHMGRWLAIRMDFTACVCVTLASILVILLRSSITPGLAGVILVQCLQLTGSVQLAVRQAAEAENNLTSLERIKAYIHLPSEGCRTTKDGFIDSSWPSKGEINFEDYTMTYRVGLPPVLIGVSFKVDAGEKVGILGRTGSGKSSLASALFRMVENEQCSGNIFVDGVNIKHVGLDDLRQRLSIISQDPILFKGSLRFNLDPFQARSDKEICEALARVNLTGRVQRLEKGLDSMIMHNGENFSVGERQLLCLARVLLRRSHVVVMDEATASVDGETDKFVQATIRRDFHDCTLLTIAHRIETVIDCHRLLILSTEGCIAEFDSPRTLLQDDNGVFAKMVRQSGPLMSQRLLEATQLGEKCGS